MKPNITELATALAHTLKQEPHCRPPAEYYTDCTYLGVFVDKEFWFMHKANVHYYCGELQDELITAPVIGYGASGPSWKRSVGHDNYFGHMLVDKVRRLPTTGELEKDHYLGYYKAYQQAQALGLL